MIIHRGVEKMIEYEYSFKVKNIEPYINYCKENNYDLEKNNYQVRELYKNENKILARITTEIEDEKRICVLDFKDDNNTEVLIKEARETIPLKITEENRKSVDSILKILDFHKDKIIERNRMTYKKGKVSFEIDEYFKPEKGYVVAIEGEKELVDKTYVEIKEKLDKKTKEN